MYCWAAVEGYSAFGTYEGNTNPDGAVILKGIKPKSVMIKNIDSATSWYKVDSARGPYNSVKPWLQPHDAAAELTTLDIDLLSIGFKLRNSSAAFNQDTCMYAVWGTPTLNQSSTPVKAR
jgi:hypothetical protein